VKRPAQEIDRFQDSPARRFPRTVCSVAGVSRTGLFLVLSSLTRLHATEEVATGVHPEATAELATSPHPVAAKGKTGDGNEWVVAPIPTLNPSQGFGLQVIGQYVFKSPQQAPDTPASIVAVGGFYTEEKSWGLFGGYLGHWQDDKWRPMAGGGYADVNYDFYGVGNSQADRDLSVRIEQQATFGLAQLLRRIVPGLYAGLRLAASETTAATSGVNAPPIVLPPLERDINGCSAAFVAQWDTRDNQFYPRQGQDANFSASFHDGDYTYQIYSFDWNGYYALGDRAVLAARVFLRSTGGDAPFYALSQFGMHNDLRGYKSGKYRDNDMFATQVEYRHQLSPRWGFVVFAGVGEVMPSFDELNADDLLSSAGAGLRFRVAKSHPINLRLDWAYGDESAFYLGVNEAF
jgi:hypothetical protein